MDVEDSKVTGTSVVAVRSVLGVPDKSVCYGVCRLTRLNSSARSKPGLGFRYTWTDSFTFKKELRA